MRRKWLAVTIGVLVVIGCVIGIRQIWVGKSEQTLTKEDAIEAAQTKYSGDVKKIVSSDGVYKINMQNEFGIYKLKLDRDTGHIVDLALVKKFEPNEKKANEPSKSKQLQPIISKNEAKQIALKKIKGRSKVTEIESAVENGRSIYQVTVQNSKGETELTINGMTGEVLFYSAQEGYEERHTPKGKDLSEIKVSPEEAKQIALSETKGAIDEIKLESSSGSFVYKVDMEADKQDATVVIQAYTGEVLSVTFEKQDEEDNDNDTKDDADIED